MSPRRRPALAAFVTFLILVACWIPGHWLHENRLVQSLGHTDKLVHGTMFAFFGLFWTLGEAARRRLALVVAAGIGLAVLTEVGQGHPLVNRDPDVFDGLADILGMLLGIVAARFLSPARPRVQVGDSSTASV